MRRSWPGRSSESRAESSIAASPPFFISARAPVAVWSARERSGSWPTRRTSLAPGRELPGVEVAAAQRLGHLGLDAERLAGEPGGLEGPDLGAREAGVDPHLELGQGGPGGPRLALALRRQPARGVVIRGVLGVTVAQQPDHSRDRRS